MSVKSKLKHSIHQVLKSDNTKGYTTKHDRKGLLITFANDLFERGYKIEDIRNLKQKHIKAVVMFWKESGLSSGSIKNRLSAVRRLALLMNKSFVVPSNKALEVAPRKYVSDRNRALNNPDFSQITDSYIRLSLELQRVFGLRREECMKIQPHNADKKDRLVLQASWCKGGRERSIPIRTDEQGYWLDQAKNLLINRSDSLIPTEKAYITQRHLYNTQVYRAGLRNLHGLRHAYAQARYKELTSWEAPINGGPTSRELTEEQKQIDYEARMVLTEELGHSREQITANYLGR